MSVNKRNKLVDKGLDALLQSFNQALNEYIQDPEKLKLVNESIKELRDKLAG